MKKKIVLRVLTALILTTASLAAQAQLINFDLTSLTLDPYGPGAAVFGTGSSTWNSFGRASSATNLALTDDTAAATSVTVSYTRAGGSGQFTLTGAYANLGTSFVQSGAVDIAGLAPNAAYQLAVFNFLTTSVTVNGVTHSITSATDWSSLTEGSQYALFNTTADGTGHLQFTSSTGRWTAWQLQDAPVPEPASFGLLGLGLAGLAIARRRKAA